jgi:hypothetical protein
MEAKYSRYLFVGCEDRDRAAMETNPFKRPSDEMQILYSSTLLGLARRDKQNRGSLWA